LAAGSRGNRAAEIGVIFSKARIAGAWLIDIERLGDERGFFARTWCQRELTAQGLDAEIAQESTSWNLHKGTTRGLHFQRPPHEEVKIVRCTRGAIFDVIVDIRPDSPTFRSWQGVELSADNRRAFYIPKGCAHGFQTLANETEVAYLISAFYAPEAAAGIRYNDPAFGISWPLPAAIISDNDRRWPDFSAETTDASAR
jgi:dTDP-4-dehydrorhamnose 3,5-epimerase